MPDPRDPAIKLFGQSIVPPEGQPPPDLAGSAAEDVCIGAENKELDALKPDARKEVDQNELSNSSGASNSNEDDHHISTIDANTEQDRVVAETSNQEKALKKPDKILPCPRCKSMDTKFCYFNNYNVNQPRHFCKNCHRYWTAGGTMRNVPVGAGKRKSKVSTSNYRHTMMVADGMPYTDSAGSVVISGVSSVHLRPLKEKAPVQSFRPEAPVSESVVSVQADKRRNTEIGSCGEDKNKNESLCASSSTDSHHAENDSTENAVPNGQSAIHHLPCYPGAPFVFPWSPGCNSAAAMAAGWCSSDMFNGSGNVNSNLVAWSQPPTFPSPAFCAPNFAFPFMPTSFWGCMSSWPTGAWNIPWIGSNGHVTPSLSTCNGDSATTLGKHYRDAGEGERRTKSLWAPKTLRIDDPDEAAKSSIWDTLGIRPEKSISKGSVFKAFQSKTGNKAQTTDATQVLHANPVALCRSQKFQESN